MKFKKIATLLGCIMILTTGLVGCGSTSESTTETQTKTPDSLIYGIDGDPGNSVNVITTGDRYGLMEIKLLYSPLYMYNADKIVYFLAESMTPSEDNLTYTAKLKENVKWSDGEPFTADDVVFTYNEMLKEANAGWAYSQLIFEGKAVKVEKVDDYTVKFILPTVGASAIELLGNIFIMPKHIYEGETNIENSAKNATPVGTGPYKLQEYKAGQYVKFVSNEDYFLGVPKIKNIAFRQVQDANTALLALQNGEINALAVDPKDIAKLGDKSKINAVPYDEGRVGYMAFNMSSKTVENKDVRKSILYALSRNEMITASYLSDEFAKPVYSFLPNESQYSSKDLEKYDTDASKSKELLSKAGVSDLKLKLAYISNNVPQQKQAIIIQENLKKVGVTVELLGMDSTALYASLKKHDSNFDMYLGGYIMGIDPDTFNSLFITGSSSNYMGYSNPEIDKLFIQGRVETDIAKRKEIYNSIQKLLQDDAVFYPIVENKRILAIDANVNGIEEAGLVPVYTFEDMSKLYYEK
jgi:peptide/nickel transport system substrate-binding protein